MSRVRLLRVLGGFYAVSTLFNNSRQPSFSVQKVGSGGPSINNIPAVNLPPVSGLLATSVFCSADPEQSTSNIFEKNPHLSSLLSRFSFENSGYQVAFLRLLGVRKMSIATLRERGIVGCYVEGLTKLQEPRLTRSQHIVLHSFSEYVDVNLMYIDLPINSPALTGDRYKEVMGIVDNFDEENIKSLYRELSELKDEDVDFIIDTLFATEGNIDFARAFKESFLDAREFCQNYVGEKSDPTRGPTSP